VFGQESLAALRFDAFDPDGYSLRNELSIQVGQRI
jgi:hypothetical protein